jgi:hypothetical protein
MNKHDFFGSLRSEIQKNSIAEADAEQQYAKRKIAAVAFVKAITPLLESYKSELTANGVSCQISTINDYFHIAVSFPTRDLVGRDTTYQLQMEPEGRFYRWVKEYPGKNGRVRGFGDQVKVESIAVDDFERQLQSFIQDSSY